MEDGESEVPDRPRLRIKPWKTFSDRPGSMYVNRWSAQLVVVGVVRVFRPWEGGRGKPRLRLARVLELGEDVERVA